MANPAAKSRRGNTASPRGPLTGSSSSIGSPGGLPGPTRLGPDGAGLSAPTSLRISAVSMVEPIDGTDDVERKIISGRVAICTACGDVACIL